jgi:hypothetical protein
VKAAGHHGEEPQDEEGRNVVREEFGLDPTLTPVVVLAVGLADPDAELPSHLAAREAAPRTRQPVSDLLLARGASDYLSAA